jgi:hypothetical protein
MWGMFRARGSSLRDPAIKQGKLNKDGRELPAVAAGLRRKKASKDLYVLYYYYY